MILGAGIRPRRGLLAGGIVLVALSASWPYLLPSGSGSSVDVIDFVRGALLGVGVCLELVAAWRGDRGQGEAS